MSTPVATATAPASGGKAAAPVALRPFITGTRRIDQQIYDNTTVITAGQQKLPIYNLDTDGYTSGMYIMAEGTGVNVTNSVAFQQDGPFNIFAIVQFSDTNNKPIMGPMTGHDLYLITKYGGYAFSDDAKASPIYTVTTGTGVTAGSFRFILRIPIEIVHRDGLGSLLNKSASAVYKLSMTLNSNTTAVGGVFSVAPATSLNVRVRIQQFGWMDSDQADYMKNATDPNPPALNTLQYWDKQSLTISAGQMNQQINTFSGLVRNWIFELRDSTGVRTTADFPSLFELHYDKTVPISRLKEVWQHMMGEDFHYATLAESTAGQETLDDGVFAEPYTKDYGLKPGAESRFGYLPVTSATSNVLRGVIGGSGAHSLNVFVNYIWPASGDPKTLTGGR